MKDTTDYDLIENTLISWLTDLSGLTYAFWSGYRFDKPYDDNEVLIPYATIREQEEETETRPEKERQLTKDNDGNVIKVDQIYSFKSERSYDIVFHSPSLVLDDDKNEVNNRNTGERIARTFVKMVNSPQSKTILKAAGLVFMTRGRIIPADAGKPDKLIKVAAVEVFISLLNTMKDENVDFIKTIQQPEIIFEEG
jgi:hypothetical protein